MVNITALCTMIAAIIFTLVVGTIDLTGAAVGIGLLILAIFLFILLITSLYAGSPPANALFAEIIPREVLSSVYGVINALMTGFSAFTPIFFGAIVDQEYKFPYEYLLLIVFAVTTLLCLLYIKSQIGFKTPDEVEAERAIGIPSCPTIISE